MAGGGGSFLALSMRRSVQSGDKVMTLAWQTVYTDSDAIPYLFMGGMYDLTNMVGGDTIEVRIRKRTSATGGPINHDFAQYIGAQPVNFLLVRIAAIPDIYGITVEMRQTAGIFRSIPCEFITAKL